MCEKICIGIRNDILRYVLRRYNEYDNCSNYILHHFTTIIADGSWHVGI